MLPPAGRLLGAFPVFPAVLFPLLAGVLLAEVGVLVPDAGVLAPDDVVPGVRAPLAGVRAPVVGALLGAGLDGADLAARGTLGVAAGFAGVVFAAAADLAAAGVDREAAAAVLPAAVLPLFLQKSAWLPVLLLLQSISSFHPLKIQQLRPQLPQQQQQPRNRQQLQ